MNKKVIEITKLMEVKKRYEDEQEFDLFAIVDEAKKLYDAACTIGIEKVDVYYVKDDGKPEVKKAIELSEYRRAIVVVVLSIMGHDLKRLEKVFGLPEEGITKAFDGTHMVFIEKAYSVKDFFDTCFVKL